MKTPDEIKKGLEYCRGMACGTIKLDCPYEGMMNCHDVVLTDALAYIHQLEADLKIAEIKLGVAFGKLLQTERERDQAVKDCSRFMCETCAELDNGDNCSWCAVVDGHRTGYVWRGLPAPPKEDAEDDIV